MTWSDNKIPTSTRPPKCLQCGGSHFEHGTLQGPAAGAFRPTRIKFMTLKAGANIHAWACTDCGFIHIVADPYEILELVGSFAHQDARRGFEVIMTESPPPQEQNPTSPPPRDPDIHGS